MKYIEIDNLENAKISQEIIFKNQVIGTCSGIIQDEVLGDCFLLVISADGVVFPGWIHTISQDYVRVVLWSRKHKMVLQVLSNEKVVDRTLVRRLLVNIVPVVPF